MDKSHDVLSASHRPYLMIQRALALVRFARRLSMKPCSRCQATQSWTLGDGRVKCRGCGARYTAKCVWNSVRLSEQIKRSLVEAFVQGVSVYQQREDEGASVRSRERFYRL